MASNDINVLITTDEIADKLFDVFKRQMLNCVAIPNCKGNGQKSNFLDFLGFTERTFTTILFQSTDRNRRVILRYLLRNYNVKNNGMMFSIKKGVKNMKSKKQLLVAIVELGYGEEIASILQKEGECGCTIIDGRGNGVDYDSVMGMAIDSSKEIVFSAMPEELYVKMKERLLEKYNAENVSIMVFSIPISNFNKIHSKKEKNI